MIYLDNAATTFPKPPETEQEMIRALRTMGNAGRGAHETTLAAGRVIFETREMLASLFHAEDASRIAFTRNTTEALNTAIFGLLNPGDHVITTACEHNSVLRPLYLLEEKKGGIELSIVPADEKGRIDYDDMERCLRENTRAVVITHASNLTGNVTDLSRVASFTQKNHLLLIVDAAQTVGILPIDVQKMHIDVLCFPGHKGLYGPQGTGGIYVREGLEVRPLTVGGSGVHSFDRHHPGFMPAALEAGTLNAHGIAGLHGGLRFLGRVGTENILVREDRLARLFYDRVKQIPGIRFYGDFSSYDRDEDDKDKGEKDAATGKYEEMVPGEIPGDGKTAEAPVTSARRVATIALNLGDTDSAETAGDLEEHYGICVRAGAHCAPLMHETFGTKEQGAVRFSFSWFNTEEEVEKAADALREIAEDSG